MPLAPVTVLAALLHFYIGLRLVPALGPVWPWGAALVLLLVASALSMPLAFAGRRGKGRRVHEAVAWLGLLCMGLFSSLFVLTLVRDAALLVAWAASFAVALPLQALVERSAQAVPLAALLITALGFVNARRTARVVRVDVPIRDLAPALQGFLIAQISDLHVGPTIRGPYLQRIVDRVNALDADVVAVTGDLVDGSVPELAAHIAPLGDLRARHGSYVVTGNHEYYAGAVPWIRELRRLGLSVLLNEHVVLRSGGAGEGGASLALAGVTDFSAGHFDDAHRSDPAAAIAGAPDHARVRVLLAHQPRSAFAAVEAGYDLQLSGHTHGGQFWPWGVFVRFQQPFTAGLHKLRDMWVYTSRGTGYWGPPKRFGAPSEITLLRLVRAAG